jgi:multiple sugar transport system permease protein
MTKKEKTIAFLLILPSMIGVLVFYLIPFIDVLVRSFKSEVGNHIVWFQNYKSVFMNKAFLIAF